MRMFKQKPAKVIEVGETFVAEFYIDDKHADTAHNYLVLRAINGVFEMRLVGYPYGYLLAAVNTGHEDEILSFGAFMWRVTQEIYQDKGLSEDLVKALAKYDKRLMKAAEKRAKKVSEAEEIANQAYMESVAEYADADEAKRKVIRANTRAEMREALKETQA